MSADDLLRSTSAKLFTFSHELKIDDAAKKIADANNFSIQSYSFDALRENLRAPRIVKVGAVQNCIAASTTDPIGVQRDKIFEKIGNILDAAGADGVQVLCLQVNQLKR